MNIKKTLTDIFGADPQKADLVKEAQEYLSDIGLSYKEIISLEKVLSGGNIFSVLLHNAVSHIMWLFRSIADLFR